MLGQRAGRLVEHHPRCAFKRDKLKKDKDPSIDYNWLWKLVSLDAEAPEIPEAPEDVWVGDPSTIDGSAAPAPAPMPTPQPSSAPSTEMTNRDDHPAKRASIEGQAADKIRARVLEIAGRMVVAQMSYTPDLEGHDWHHVVQSWYESLIMVPSWGDDLHGEGDGE